MQIMLAGYGEATVTPTSDKRVAIFGGGRANWRTVWVDDCGSWSVTGPPYATKGEAFIFAREIVTSGAYFGHPPERFAYKR